jgi:hypothetical protein
MLSKELVAHAYQIDVDTVEDGIHWSLGSIEDFGELNGILDEALAQYFDMTYDQFDEIDIGIVDFLRKAMLVGDYIDIDLCYEEDIWYPGL